MFAKTPLELHYAPRNFRNRIAFAFIRFLRLCADVFFARRYGHRVVVLETMAAVPGMVGGALQHFRALRRMETDNSWIRTLLDEAENERQNLMTFIHVARPSRFERLLALLVQGVFYNLYFLLYVISPRTAHRVVGHLEEGAMHSYTEYLAGVDNGHYENVAAPQTAIAYWKLPPNARLRDVIVAVRADECPHRNVYYQFVNELA